MSAPAFKIELSPQAEKIVAGFQTLPGRIVQAIVRGMDEANQYAVGNIQKAHLTGKGPFPPEEHRLGVRTVDDVRALPAPLYFAGLCRVIEWESLAEWSSRSVWPLSAPLVALHATPAGRAAILTMLRGSEVRTAAGLCNWLRQETWKAA